MERLFIVPANTFDNVKGDFPIGFFIWNTNVKERFESIKIDMFDNQGFFVGNKIITITPDKNIKDWLRIYNDNENSIGWLVRGSSDVQNNRVVFITSQPSASVLNASNANQITPKNLVVNSIFHAVRNVIPNNWINNRDQYLFPNEKYKTDIVFKINCIIFSLFAESNTIKSEYGINHWIPFTEQQVGCKKAFKSNFMSKFLDGEVEFKKSDDWFSENESAKSEKVVLSEEAQNVYNAGLELWKYYHLQPKANPDASYYDIRKFFQGETKGRMNNGSSDEKYMELIGDLRNKMKLLAKKIESKVYEYGFLKQ